MLSRGRGGRLRRGGCERAEEEVVHHEGPRGPLPPQSPTQNPPPPSDRGGRGGDGGACGEAEVREEMYVLTDDRRNEEGTILDVIGTFVEMWDITRPVSYR